ncbi:MAG: low-specificity L-threonine aldolase [Anaerolineaceae bacterium]|nr:low-specificity L-threonine aldolase [Anaerolineaceae bacterium]
MEYVDLRGDTVTKPTPKMRAAMAAAEVGDDVMGEDPTVNRLQELAAEKMGKEAGLFVASGTMGNLVAILVHCQRGDEAIMGHLGHTFLYEAGGASALGGVHPHLVPNQPDGTLLLEDIQEAVRIQDPHFPPSRLVILENTHNRCGGVPISLEYTLQVGDLAQRNELKLHLDGARIFNAAVALGVSARELAEPVDSVTFCLSKGLCVPVGAVLCGSREFIQRALYIRKQLGGGMRQVGILAAAGIVALEDMVERLADDHRRAQMLARGLAGLSGLKLDTEKPLTNIVFVTLETQTFATNRAAEIAEQLARDYQIKVGVVNPHRFRMVTHYWIDDEDIHKTVEAFEKVLSKPA